MIVESEIDDNGLYKINLKYNELSGSFNIMPLTYPSFKAKFVYTMSELISSIPIDSVTKVSVIQPSKEVIDKYVPELFARIVTVYNTEDDKPVVADIHLKNNAIIVYAGSDGNGGRKPIGRLKDIKAEISFYDGFIEKIQVHGKMKYGDIEDYDMTFNNFYSIGISSTKNINNLAAHSLFSDEVFDLKVLRKLENDYSKKNGQGVSADSIAKSIPRQKGKTYYSHVVIKVSDILRYVKKIDVNANDVSPNTQVVLLDEENRSAKLYREESTKLFEAVVYTDFYGLFDEDSPNGIVQLEVNKGFNINTNRTDFWQGGLGWLHKVTGSFQYSKIEDNNKYLLPETYEIIDENDEVSRTINYYSHIGMYQHRNYFIGGLLNIMNYENQNQKILITLDSGLLFGRTGLKENEEDEKGYFVNNLEWPTELKIRFIPEKRLSFDVSDRLSWFETFSSDIEIQTLNNNVLGDESNWLNTINFDFNLNISKTGKLFLRYKFTHELNNFDVNFSRFQFGYSFYILKSNGVRPKS